MKAAGKELKTAMKRDELDIAGIERMQDDMADIMVPPRTCREARQCSLDPTRRAGHTARRVYAACLPYIAQFEPKYCAPALLRTITWVHAR